jgi:hypothetical protein
MSTIGEVVSVENTENLQWVDLDGGMELIQTGTFLARTMREDGLCYIAFGTMNEDGDIFLLDDDAEDEQPAEPRWVRADPHHLLVAGGGGSFQSRVDPWLKTCFGEAIARDRVERNHRFLEEALETTQAAGCTRSEAHQLVDYVFDRPVGELPQEVGGAQVALAALCLAHGIDMAEAGDIELSRIWTKVEAIRAKQAAKPKHSPLPQDHVSALPVDHAGEIYD